MMKKRRRTIWINGKSEYYARYVMETFLGRSLCENEVVHHVDGNPLNDSLSNLQVIDDREHRSLHPRGKIVSKNIRAKIGAALRGNTLSEEHRAKIGSALRGRTFSKETKAKISAALRGEKNSCYKKVDMDIVDKYLCEGKSKSEIASLVGIHRNTLYKKIKANNVKERGQ